MNPSLFPKFFRRPLLLATLCALFMTTVKVTKTELTFNAIISKSGEIFDTVSLRKGAESITV